MQIIYEEDNEDIDHIHNKENIDYTRGKRPLEESITVTETTRNRRKRSKQSGRALRVVYSNDQNASPPSLEDSQPQEDEESAIVLNFHQNESTIKKNGKDEDETVILSASKPPRVDPTYVKTISSITFDKFKRKDKNDTENSIILNVPGGTSSKPTKMVTFATDNDETVVISVPPGQDQQATGTPGQKDSMSPDYINNPDTNGSVGPRKVVSAKDQQTTGTPGQKDSMSPVYINNHDPNGSVGPRKAVSTDYTVELTPGERAEQETKAAVTTLQSIVPIHESGLTGDAFKSLSSSKSIITVKGTCYIKLEQIGRGGSSKVYKVLGPDYKTYALKKVKLQRGDKASLVSYANEITLLQRLRGRDGIITLYNADINVDEGLILIIMEYGEIDLKGFLDRERRACDGKIDENFIRLAWQQMLQAVDAIHEERIIHADLKPSNFLFVQGKLKLIDFGIAKALSADTTNIMRDSQVGTLNYMSPEALVDTQAQSSTSKCMKLGRSSDIWSLGCILYEMVYGHPPFSELNSIVKKLSAIIDPHYQISFPPLNNNWLLDTMQSCLLHNAALRPSISGSPSCLLFHPFLQPYGERAMDIEKTSQMRKFSQVKDATVQLLNFGGVEVSNDNAIQIAKYLVKSIGKPSKIDLEPLLKQLPKSHSKNRMETSLMDNIVNRTSLRPLTTEGKRTSRTQSASKPQLKLSSDLQESIATGRRNLISVTHSDKSKYQKEPSHNIITLTDLLKHQLMSKFKNVESNHTVNEILPEATDWTYDL